ncbi:MAG: lysozyme [Thermoplasmata archaeon]|nr:lysozyme [Thermoplasmata archaeon]
MIHRQITSAGSSLIKSFEGFSATRYLCSARVWTIGYGHAIRKGEKWDSSTAIITESEALGLFDKDNDDAEKAVFRLIRIVLTDGMFDALVSFTFNLGSGALQRSTLRSMLNREEYMGAANQFPFWCWAGGYRNKGLYRRRLRERELFLS